MEQQYTIEPITEADRNEVIQCLVKYFFPSEPLNQFLQLDPNHNLDNSANSVEVQHCADCIAENCSFKAINRSGKIIGVSLNVITKKQAKPPSAPEGLSGAEKVLEDFLAYTRCNFSVFDVHPEFDRCLEAYFICVDDNYRNMGIGGALIKQTIEYMRKNGICLFFVNCTSFFSAKMCERQGLTADYVLRYKDYFVDGKNPLIPAEPHDAFRCFTRIV